MCLGSSKCPPACILIWMPWKPYIGRIFILETKSYNGDTVALDLGFLGYCTVNFTMGRSAHVTWSRETSRPNPRIGSCSGLVNIRSKGIKWTAWQRSIHDDFTHDLRELETPEKEFPIWYLLFKRFFVLSIQLALHYKTFQVHITNPQANIE